MSAAKFPGPYQIQAAINAVHADAPSAETTDWLQILALYDQLVLFDDSPVVSLNRAVALAEVQGVEVALGSIEDLPLERYYLFHSVRADFLRRLGRVEEAVDEYDEALGLTQNETERAFWCGPAPRCFPRSAPKRCPRRLAQGCDLGATALTIAEANRYAPDE